MADILVRQVSGHAVLPLDDDGTPLHNGERMVEIGPGQWVTPLAAEVLALLAEVDRG